MLGGLFAALQGEGLAARARRGSILTVMQFGGQNVIRLVSNLILTRLLFPEAFGLMALIQVVTTGLAMFSDVGLRASLIQNPKAEDPRFFNTAWTLQIFRGVCLAAATALLAPYVADFYDEPMLAQLMPVAGLTAFLAGFIPTKVILANRNMQLGRLTVIDLSNQVLSLAITALLAWLTQSVWALVFGMLASGVTRNIALRLFLPGPPNRLAWDKAMARELIGFGKFIFISTFATFIIQNADKAILGKYITIDALGVYTIALTLASVPMMLSNALASKIFFPLYSRRKPHESPADREKILKARFAVTGVTMLGSVLLVLVGDPLVRFLYDARYDAAAPITILVALGFMPHLVTATYNPILLANGRSDLHAVLTISHALLKLAALFAMIRSFGVVGAALAPAISTLLYYPLMVGLTRRYRAWDPRHDAFGIAVACCTAILAWWLYADRLAEISLG